MQGFRTDLAAEEIPQGGGELSGVRSETYDRDGFTVTRVEILDPQGADVLCKPMGNYITVDVETFVQRRENSFGSAVSLLAEFLRELIPLSDKDSVLVAGLGNQAITPDAVGPELIGNGLLVGLALCQHTGYLLPLGKGERFLDGEEILKILIALIQIFQRKDGAEKLIDLFCMSQSHGDTSQRDKLLR